MSKAKADAIQVDVLAENQARLDSYEKSIKAVQERRRKVIIESKLYTYDKLSELYGGKEWQELLNAVTAEHTLIGKLTASGMSYADIEGLVGSSDSDDTVGQTSFFGDNSYSD